jgi:hypothetical protein
MRAFYTDRQVARKHFFEPPQKFRSHNPWGCAASRRARDWGDRGVARRALAMDDPAR